MTEKIFYFLAVGVSHFGPRGFPRHIKELPERVSKFLFFYSEGGAPAKTPAMPPSQFLAPAYPLTTRLSS